jgi:hypothetical protein
MNWRKSLKWGLIGLVAVLVVVQLVPYGRSHDNPSVVAEPAGDSPATRDLAVRACFDCHSNEVVWPWYTNVAPISWLATSRCRRGTQGVEFLGMGTPPAGRRRDRRGDPGGRDATRPLRVDAPIGAPQQHRESGIRSRLAGDRRERVTTEAPGSRLEAGSETLLTFQNLNQAFLLVGQVFARVVEMGTDPDARSGSSVEPPPRRKNGLVDRPVAAA